MSSEVQAKCTNFDVRLQAVDGAYLLLDKILHGFDVMVGRPLQRFDPCSIGQGKFCVDLFEGLRLRFAERRQIHDLVARCQCRKPATLYLDPGMQQAVFAEDGGEWFDPGAITPIEGAQGEKGVEAHA